MKLQSPISTASGKMPSVCPNKTHEQLRFRFNLKYIGSSILHKNFTMPMLEWIAKDMKRQTMRGGQSTSQRQFSIPVRDIVFDIQPNKLTGISCKDGHCIFMHPMHCVSKYAQLQFDPTCFSYIIRDSKESAAFCHIFQGKSANRVHDVFTAIRKVTTSYSQQPLEPSTPAQLSSAANPNFINGLRKSASSDCSPRQESIRDSQIPNITPNLKDSNQSDRTNSQFENSYQFEVMFVKKVKLQCRRVPSSFVDDALETLKSYEVLKNGDSKVQIKGLGNRIINASVDERQEYDESCQSANPSQTNSSTISSTRHLDGAEEQRRGSTCSLVCRKATQAEDERESRSCQQSPMKSCSCDTTAQGSSEKNPVDNHTDGQQIKKHQSMDSLKSIDWTIKSARDGDTPTYTNDFSPYNTITSSDLNERIAAIPVVSSSVSLDQETRQRLARQVRETIMATAATIKKDVYASGDKLDSSSSSKALDSLSCTATSSVPALEDSTLTLWAADSSNIEAQNLTEQNFESRRSSIGLGATDRIIHQQSTSNNFDLFRRASARQVVKNRTMLLLIGRDELCTISIDKHQMLFSKSLNSIVHCLQGSNNRDHFGLICRDSGKINPNTESYAGFVFKCQSEKVVREIMGALKQVIYNSQNNYHGYNSPYNPLHSMGTQLKPATQTERPSGSIKDQIGQTDGSATSLVAKRGFANPIKVEEAARLNRTNLAKDIKFESSSASVLPVSQNANLGPQKNLIKSMFCDSCPMYWFHRLCCDIESLPAEVSKTIILRRIDSSLTDKEQDEVYSKFGEFDIQSIEEHNEIFMSILRHLSEKKQMRHNQTQPHLSAMAAKNQTPNVKQSSTVSSIISLNTSLGIKDLSPGIRGSDHWNASDARNTIAGHGHHRSGSSGGSLSDILNKFSIEAGTSAMDNLMRAKNSISVSIDNILKRRSSTKEELEDHIDIVEGPNLSQRGGSFRSKSGNRSTEESSSLKRSQSTTENHQNTGQTQTQTWRGSLNRTINDDNPIVGLFRRRSSTFSSKGENTESKGDAENTRVSTECLVQPMSASTSAQVTQPSSPSLTDIRFNFPLVGQHQQSNNSSSSSMLSGAFWKKNIFDKVRQPASGASAVEVSRQQQDQNCCVSSEDTLRSKGELTHSQKVKRTREELRGLWKKAIVEQITLLKMEKQNQKLQSNGPDVECNIQMIKLNYDDIIHARDAKTLWRNLLKQDPTQKVDFVEVARHIRLGVPKHQRGEVWMFLMNQYQLRHGTSFQPSDCDYTGDANQNFRSLLSQLSVQQHEIFVDIGRTFPSHPYYSQYLSIGQLSLFNLLKAYSLLDPDVGYCQGLSFVAGILLLHVESEDEAFELMRHLLFNFGLRKQYLPSMNALHLQLYQMTRLLRDYEYELFNHFDRYDISPSLYAAPWFLTLFASQFPLNFVSRFMDILFLIGIEAIFRVSLNLLAYHRSSIVARSSLESTMEFMRSELFKINEKNLVKIFDDSISMDLRNKLIEYEIEYTFYCAEDRARRTNVAVKGNDLGINRSHMDCEPRAKAMECDKSQADESQPMSSEASRADEELESTSKVNKNTSCDSQPFQDLVRLLVNWINDELNEQRIIVIQLEQDLHDGQILGKLVEKLSGMKLDIDEVIQSEET